MIVLGIDPSLANLGYAVVSRAVSGRHQWLASGTIHTKPAHPLDVRLLQLSESLRSIIDTHQPEIAVVERPAIHGDYGRGYGRSGDAGGAKALGNAAARADFNVARGAILVTLSLAGIRVVEVKASRITKDARAAQNRIVFPALDRRSNEHERDALFYAWAGPLPMKRLA